jgi:hypothetical protein
MARFVRFCVLAAASSLSCAAVAQDAPGDRDAADIVVTGKKEMERQLREFVGALTRPKPNDNISRFEWEACPAAAGLSDAQEQAVVGRMRRIAEAAGVPLGKIGCIPNVVVVATHDKSDFIEALADRHPAYFDTLSRHEVRKLARSPGPAAAWHIAGPTLDADGVEMPVERFGTAGSGQAGIEVRVNQTTRAASRLTLSTRSHFTAAVVVVEAKALEGLTTTQLADYAAMRAFARLEPARLTPDSPPTILKVLEAPMGSPVPITMTRWDLGFLKGLYGGHDTLYAAARRSEIRKRIQKELEASEARD